MIIEKFTVSINRIAPNDYGYTIQFYTEDKVTSTINKCKFNNENEAVLHATDFIKEHWKIKTV